MRDLMVAAVEARFGRVNRLPRPVGWLNDHGSCYVARDTRTFARDIGLLPKTTLFESPQSKGMAEPFVRTFNHDYVRVRSCADAQTVLRSLPAWFTRYNEVHSHRALGYRSPRAVHPCHLDNLTRPIFRGQQHLGRATGPCALVRTGRGPVAPTHLSRQHEREVFYPPRKLINPVTQFPLALLSADTLLCQRQQQPELAGVLPQQVRQTR